MKLVGRITDVAEEGFTLFVPFEKTYLLEKWGAKECDVEISDSRNITSAQRRKIYPTLNDISLYTGYTPQEAKEACKYDFIAKTGNKEFSLSDVPENIASEFLQYLIDFCIEWGIPTQDNMIERSPDIARYLYGSLMNKRCCICGGKAELHHLDAVGSGRNRKEIVHKGLQVLPLCRRHHTECHSLGKQTFCDKWHVFGIRCDSDICKIYKIKE